MHRRVRFVVPASLGLVLLLPDGDAIAQHPQKLAALGREDYAHTTDRAGKTKRRHGRSRSEEWTEQDFVT